MIMPDYHTTSRIIFMVLAACAILAALAIGALAVRFVKPAIAFGAADGPGPLMTWRG